MRKQLFFLMVALCLWGCQSQEQADTGIVESDSTRQEPTLPQADGDFSAAGLEAAEVEQFFGSLEQAIAADDRRKVASLIAYPLTVDVVAGEPLTIRDAATFVQHYDDVVTGAVRQAVANAEAATLFANWQGVRVGQGEVWFSGVYEEDDVEEQDYVVKITAINPTALDSTDALP